MRAWTRLLLTAVPQRPREQEPPPYPGTERTRAQGASPRQQVWLGPAASLQAECPLLPWAAPLQLSATDGAVTSTRGGHSARRVVPISRLLPAHPAEGSAHVDRTGAGPGRLSPPHGQEAKSRTATTEAGRAGERPQGGTGWGWGDVGRPRLSALWRHSPRGDSETPKSDPEHRALPQGRAKGEKPSTRSDEKRTARALVSDEA